jgi:AcrR family transcriptional regulator
MAAAALDTRRVERRYADAALACFAAYGVRKTSLSDVAERAGVSRSTAYRVFGDKRGMVAAVVAAELARFVDELGEAVPWDAPLADALESAVGFTLDFLRHHTPLQRLLASEPELFADVMVEGPGRLSLIEAARPAAAELIARSPHAKTLRVAPEPAAEWIVRIVFSFAVAPSTSFDEPREIVGLLLGGAVRRG